ncbi:carbonic anhydrase 4b [Trichomycterus rosablanca]|uniref:carbonic anhydrase 4b n=1 Tax=Trichomycterus rosablanca TaxID=2290929 RepID=UPI002F358D7B
MLINLVLSDWCYQSQVSCDHTCKGPDEWVDIVPMCGGTNQSPINIVTKKRIIQNFAPLKFHGYQSPFQGLIFNNGHTVKLSLPGTATIDGGKLEDKYKAMEIHFHWGKNGGPGSEHTIDGEQYPMEMHIVHIKEKYSSVQEATEDTSGLAVLGVFFQESGSANKNYDSIIDALPNITQPSSNSSLSLASLDMLIPQKTKFYRYQGSLTTPNCSEAVIWTVFEKPVDLDVQQLSAFSNLIFSNETAMVKTFRPVQPLNGREVYYSGATLASASIILVISGFLTACWTVLD